MKLAKRVSTLTPSTTLAITAKANELKAQGIDMIGLGAGEPDFHTPAHIVEAAYQSMLKGLTRYTPAAGLPALKDAIIDKLKHDQGLTYERSEMIVGSGAKHVLYLLFQALLDDGDEVIVPIPAWVSYPEQIKLAGGVPINVVGEESNQFKVTAEQIEAAITNRTKAVILNSPNNPSGMLYDESSLRAIGEVCLKHNLLIVSDEIYEKLIYDGQRHVSVAQLSGSLKANTILINGVSKSHAMTGWRIGYAAGNKLLIQAMTNLASHSTSNPTTSAQYAAIEAYNGPQDTVEEMRQAFEERRNKTYDQLVEIPGLTCIKPEGAFYFLANITETAKLCGCKNSDELAAMLLEEAHVAVVPGTDFGMPNHIRLSYATSQEQLDEAIRRIKQFVEQKMNE